MILTNEWCEKETNLKVQGRQELDAFVSCFKKL